jgi:hypothetical protein
MSRLFSFNIRTGNLKRMNRHILNFHDKDWSDSLGAPTWLARYPRTDISLALGDWRWGLIQLRKPVGPVATLQPDTRYKWSKNWDDIHDDHHQALSNGGKDNSIPCGKKIRRCAFQRRVMRLYHQLPDNLETDDVSILLIKFIRAMYPHKSFFLCDDALLWFTTILGLKSGKYFQAGRDWQSTISYLESDRPENEQCYLNDDNPRHLGENARTSANSEARSRRNFCQSGWKRRDER